MTGPVLPEAHDSTARYFVREFICQGNEVKASQTIGSRRIRAILNERPNGCLYAVLQASASDSAEVIVADMAELVVCADGWVALGRHWVFPSLEAARACYASVEYQAARAARQGAATVHLSIVEGLPAR